MRWVATAGVSMRIVRNFGILKIVLLIPTLSDQYNTGPFEVSLTINPITKIGILKKHNKKPDNKNGAIGLCSKDKSGDIRGKAYEKKNKAKTPNHN